MPILDAKSSIDAVVRDYAFPDIHIGAGEDESPWVPFRPNVFIRHLDHYVSYCRENGIEINQKLFA
jgi:hypothetical protein